MYQIEKVLLGMHFRKQTEYPSGVIVYEYYDDDEGPLGLKILLFSKHKPKVWEINAPYPYLISTSNLSPVSLDHIPLMEYHLERVKELRNKLLTIDKPWQIVEEEKV